MILQEHYDENTNKNRIAPIKVGGIYYMVDTREP